MPAFATKSLLGQLKSRPKFESRTSQIQVQSITPRLDDLFSKDHGKKQECGDLSFINLHKTAMLLEGEEKSLQLAEFVSKQQKANNSPQF
jgi:HPt (histidine-containing phosphotransfer) domain-containing protein